MGFRDTAHRVARRSKHYLIGLGFWQAWQMLVLCTDAVAPSSDVAGFSLKTIVLVTTTLGYIVVMAACAARPHLLESRRSLIATGSTMAAGTFLMMLVPYISDPALEGIVLTIAACGMAWGNAALLLMWGELWKTLATGRVGQHLYLSYAFAFVLFFVGIALPHPLDGLFACLFPAASTAILASCNEEPKRRPTSHPLDMQDVPFVKLFTFVLALSLVWGVSQALTPPFGASAGATEFIPLSMLVAGIAIGALALNLVITSPESESIALFRPVVPAIACGVMAIVLLPQEWAFIGNGILTMGIYCLDMFFMLIATDIAFRANTSAAFVFGSAVLTARIGTTVGSFAATGLLAASGQTPDHFVMLVFAVCALGIIAVVSASTFTKADLLALYSTSRSKRQEEQTEQPSADTAPLPLTQRCAHIAEAAGLTARETEVLELLVRGRTVQDVCSELTIAQGTAKHHVSNIYRKLGVGDRRSLYDIVEGS